MRRFVLGSAFVVAAVTSACSEESPTISDSELFPLLARTVEVRLPFEQFATSVQVLGGYGTVAQLPSATVAHRFGGLESRMLLRFVNYPASATVTDSTGSSRLDDDLTFLGGQVLVRFDTLSAQADGPVTLAGGALQSEWDGASASWTRSIDSLGASVEWQEAGAGPVRMLDTAVWDPEVDGDSVLLAVDSATVAAWGDTTDLTRGFRLEPLTEGVRLRVSSALLLLDTKPSINPDTIVSLAVGVRDLTFVFDPPPPDPVDELRIGGAPAWRSVLEVDLPATLSPSDEFCAQVRCPFELDPEDVTLASLLLQSSPTEPAYRPADTLFIDARPVLSPDRLPKSPLGNPLSLLSQRLPPEFFGEGPSAQTSVNVTGFIRDAIAGETSAGQPAPTTLALLSTLEPQLFEYASFQGPDAAGAPMLRLLITTADVVGLP